jgi:hypothetical protein
VSLRAGLKDLEERFLPLPGIELRFLGSAACNFVTILTELSDKVMFDETNIFKPFH